MYILSQEELEKPAKVHQIEALRSDVKSIAKTLEEIKQQTKGVVSFDVMEKYVDKRIEEKTKHLNEHKTTTTKLGWALLLLIIGDIATRVFNVIR